MSEKLDWGGSMSEKLEPCPTPWCGNEEMVLVCWSSTTGQYHVQCETCGVRALPFLIKNEAIKAWNTRSNPYKAMCERLAKALETGIEVERYWANAYPEIERASSNPGSNRNLMKHALAAYNAMLGKGEA